MHFAAIDCCVFNIVQYHVNIYWNWYKAGEIIDTAFIRKANHAVGAQNKMNCELAQYCSFECTVAVAHYKGNCVVMRVSTTWIELKKMAESMDMLILY